MPPRELLEQVAAGALEIVGATVRDRKSGRVLGHMQIVGDVVRKGTAGLGLGPLSAVAEVASSLASNVQLAHLQQTVNSLGLISTVGAVASVAGIGVSIAGFALVMAQLQSMDAKLDAILGKFEAIQRAIDGLDRKLDLLTLSRFLHGKEQIAIGEACQEEGQRRQLLMDAADEFGLLRKYYALLLRASPLAQYDIPVPAAVEAYGRFVAASLGELKARMLLGDLNAYRETARFVASDAESTMTLDAVALFRARSLGVASKSPLIKTEVALSAGALRQACEDLAEARDRLATCVEIGHFMADHQLTPHDYLSGLQVFREPNLIFLPNKFWEATA